MSRRRYFSLVTGVLWGTVYPGIVLALKSFTAVQFAFLRVTLAAVALGVVLAWWHRPTRLTLHGGIWSRLIVLSLFGVGVFYLAQTYAVQFSTPINVSFIIASHPLLVAVLAPLVVDESVDRTDLAGLGFGVVGVYLIIGNGRLIPLFSSRTFLGDALALLGAGTFALYLVFHRRWASRIETGQRTLTFFILGGAIPLLAIPALYEGAIPSQVNPVAAAALVWVAVVATTGGYLTLNLGLSEETSILTALRLLLIPFVSTIFSALVLGTPVTVVHGIGGLAIAIGVLVPHLRDTKPV